MMFRICLLVAVCCSLAVGSTSADDLPAGAIVVCGMDEVFIVDVDSLGAGKGVEKLWSWKATDRADVPENLRRQFATTDDCKPVRQGTQILISSSSGGCALVERGSKRVLWSASVPAAHSIELLPDDWIVVAAATARKGGGDRLVVFDAKNPGEPVTMTPLKAAHGVVWDDQRRLLWAVGLNVLEAYELVPGDGRQLSLKRVQSHPLPSEGGHELRPIPGSSDLIVSTHDHVELFDREKATFRRHPVLGDLTHVKCATIHPATGRLLCVQATAEQWWTSQFRLLTPDATLTVPGEKIYKARWASETSAQSVP